jgi:hypothetical protein
MPALRTSPRPESTVSKKLVDQQKSKSSDVIHISPSGDDRLLDTFMTCNEGFRNSTPVVTNSNRHFLEMITKAKPDPENLAGPVDSKAKQISDKKQLEQELGFDIK